METVRVKPQDGTQLILCFYASGLLLLAGSMGKPLYENRRGRNFRQGPLRLRAFVRLDWITRYPIELARLIAKHSSGPSGVIPPTRHYQLCLSTLSNDVSRHRQVSDFHHEKKTKGLLLSPVFLTLTLSRFQTPLSLLRLLLLASMLPLPTLILRRSGIIDHLVDQRSLLQPNPTDFRLLASPKHHHSLAMFCGLKNMSLCFSCTLYLNFNNSSQPSLPFDLEIVSRWFSSSV